MPTLLTKSDVFNVVVKVSLVAIHLTTGKTVWCHQDCLVHVCTCQIFWYMSGITKGVVGYDGRGGISREGD